MSGNAQGTTSVPTVSFTDTGFVVPLQSDIVTGLGVDWNSALGGSLNLSPTTPQGQLITTMAAILGDCNDQLVSLFNNIDPAYASGRYQDAIGRIYFMSRLPALPTVLEVTCTGLVGVVIPQGAQIVDLSGNLYSCTGQVVIGGNGTVIGSFSCTATGSTAVPAGNGVSIYVSIAGWNTVAVASGVVGKIVESRSEFEVRRQLSVAKNGAGFLPTVQGTVLAVPGVLQCYVTENFLGTSAVKGGVTLLPNSLYVCVAGGASQDIANAIWSKKNPGCNYNGNTTVTVLDTSTGYSPPYPSYPVTFEIPTGAPIVFNVTITTSTQVPSNATSLIQAAIQNGFTGQDGGSVASIGSTIYASRYYADVATLGSWVNIQSIQLGCALIPTSSFTASIAGTALTVTGTPTGTIAIGQFVHGTNVAPGTIITAGSGTAWTVAVNQTVASTAMSGVAAASNSVDVQINWLPTLQNADVNLILAAQP